MTQIIFVSDYFSNDLVGGAELTSEALIESSPFKVLKIRSQNLTQEILQKHHNDHWIFGNWTQINFQLLPLIIGNLSYSILEYDYKFCKYRSPDKHFFAENKDCDCHQTDWGNFVAAFFLGAKTIWWMSERQQQNYLNRFPDLQKIARSSVLSSVFSESFWLQIKRLNDNKKERNGWAVLSSSSWIKGTDDALKWCKDNGKEVNLIENLSPDQVLELLSRSEGLVYLPKGGDTCPRIVIEAKLLGCKLQINDNVEHANEDWFTQNDEFTTQAYLYAAREFFWNGIKEAIEWRPTISGYTTVRNCIEMEYPWEDTINSMLGFCDEVVVLDGGSTDGTWERLQKLASENSKIVAHQIVRDWNSKRFAIFDGQQKAEARKLCTKEFCWQMDSDEILPESDWNKIRSICKNLNPVVDLVSLPVVEYWGSKEKVRMDVTPWKWRLSRNRPYITHGLPKQFRRYDENGEMYAAQGSDGCNYIHAETLEEIPFVGFYTQDAHNVRMAALQGNIDALQSYENWFNQVVENIPSVRHFSWYDLERKIRTYRDFWQRFWESLYDIKQEDTPENNMFFDKKWSEVTDEEIKELAERLKNETGGHVFHRKIDFSSPTPFVRINE